MITIHFKIALSLLIEITHLITLIRHRLLPQGIYIFNFQFLSYESNLFLILLVLIEPHFELCFGIQGILRIWRLLLRAVNSFDLLLGEVYVESIPPRLGLTLLFLYLREIFLLKTILVSELRAAIRK